MIPPGIIIIREDRHVAVPEFLPVSAGAKIPH
jgi:hypothetical protein